MKKYENQHFDEERALYNSNQVELVHCSFDGPRDGESALKESKDIVVNQCFFNLRYPFWHDINLQISNSELTPLCRAALWYSSQIYVENTKFHGIKALRECNDVTIKKCDIISPEFGWSVNHITMEDSKAESEYFMMRSEDLHFKNVEFKGKYSFQYIKNATFDHCIFDTKDAFWHGENIVVTDSIVRGEYLAWYSSNLTLIRCKIIGTQPFCYCKNLKLIDCEMEHCDLAFERSNVDATILSSIDSVKNPYSGVIKAYRVDQIVLDDPKAQGIVEIIKQK